MKKILEFLSENFQFLVVKFSVYLNRRVFVMTIICVVGRGYVPANTERRCNVTTLQRRCIDVVASLCICWKNHRGILQI